MANPTRLVTVTFAAAGITAVGSVRARLERDSIDGTVLGESFSRVDLGVLSCSGSMELMFDKSDHAALVNAVKNASAAQTLVITWNTGETWTGPARILSCEAGAQVRDMVRATVEFVSDGDWSAGV